MMCLKLLMYIMVYRLVHGHCNYLTSVLIMWPYFLIFLTIYGSVYGKTEEEIKMELTKLIMKCNEKSETSLNELMQLQNFIVPTNQKTKCVLACAYKAAKIMTPDGMYDLKHAYDVAEMVKNGDEKRLENGKKMADLCVQVNDVKVSDPDKGCDRAALIFKCTVENAVKFGFKI